MLTGGKEAEATSSASIHGFILGTLVGVNELSGEDDDDDEESIFRIDPGPVPFDAYTDKLLRGERLVKVVWVVFAMAIAAAADDDDEEAKMDVVAVVVSFKAFKVLFESTQASSWMVDEQ